MPPVPVVVASLVAAASLWPCAAQPTVNLTLGVLGSFDKDLYKLTAIILADLDYRKYSEPDLVTRFGPPIMDIPNSSFYPGLRVRPVIVDDQGKDAAGLAATNNFVFGLKDYPQANGLIGPTANNVALATAPCTAAYGLNQVAINGATTESLSDKARFPFFFRTNMPGSQQGRILWQYFAYFSFRGVTVLSVLEESAQAVHQGFVLCSLLAHRSEAVKAATVPITTTGDYAEWAGAVAFAKAAHNSLVIVLAPETMAGTFLRWVPNHGICAPRYQLLMTNVANRDPSWPLSMQSLHMVYPSLLVDSRALRYQKMYLQINETDILSGMKRYGLDRWFNQSRISEVLMNGSVDSGTVTVSTMWFNVFNMFVVAFGELLNAGVAPKDVGGELLRAKLAKTELATLVTRFRFDAGQDAAMNWSIASAFVYDPPVLSGGVLLKYRLLNLALCRVSKAADGTNLFDIVPVAPQRWASGAFSISAPANATACRPGQYLELAGVAPPGLCIDCPEGTFTSSSDETECVKCPAGTRGDESRAECVDCPPGQYNPDRGSKDCSLCMSGSVAPFNASHGCELCPLGTYADIPQAGATACVPCAEGLTTLQVASLGADHCVCAAGTYRPLGGGPCMRCGVGLRCPAGSDEANIPGWGSGSGDGSFPETQPMYYTKASAPFDVYLCTSDVACPGGPPETCAANHVGLVCGDCAKGYYRSPSGRCEACAASNAVPLALVIIAAAVCIVLLAIYSQQEEGSTRQTLVTAVLVAGQMVACVQALSVIQQVKIKWIQPLLSVWTITGFVSFDMDLLKVACVLRQDRPVSNFVMQLMGLPVLAVLLGVLMLVISRIRACLWKTGRKVSWDRYLNLLGLLVVMVYISITVAMLRPLICKEHPNGLRSVASRMAVICWQSTEHRTLVALSAIGVLCYPVSLLATVAWATAMYPYKAASGSLAHLSRFKFIFARFTPQCYFWGFCYLLRNLCIALVPVAVPDSGVWQMMLLCILFLPFMAMEAVLLPWRTPLANLSEVVTLVCVLLFLQASGFLVGAANGANPELVSYLLLAIILFMILTAFAVFGYALARYILPGMQYSIFLCHHKEGAGSLGRWLKMQVACVSRAAVFLDSDQLEELDLIVDTVRCRTKNLLILLTRLTLSRIWCAAEIASAVANNVPIVPLACCDYKPYTQEKLDNLGDTWSELQKHSVAQYGIHLEHILKAYEHLAGLPAVEFRRFAPLEEQRVAAFRAFNLCCVCGPSPPTREPAQAPACIVLAGASSDAEARTTCEVLQHMVQVKTQVPVVAVHSWQEARPHAGAAYLLVVLTRGLIQDAAFIEVGLEFDVADRQSPVEIVTALADTNFTFPAAETFEALESRGGDEERLAKFLRRVFNILALPVSPHGSAGIMDAQVGELCRRFKGGAMTPHTSKVDSYSSREYSSREASEDTGPRGASWRQPVDLAEPAAPPPSLRPATAQVQQEVVEEAELPAEIQDVGHDSELVTADV